MKVCASCSELKTEKEFGKRADSPDGLQYSCTKCKRDQGNSFYHRNKEKRKAQIYKTRAIRKKEVEDYLWTLLSRSPCVDCGLVDPIVACFSNEVQISDLISGSYSLKTVTSKLEGCDILCANCHTKRMAKKYNWWRSRRIYVAVSKKGISK